LVDGPAADFGCHIRTVWSSPTLANMAECALFHPTWLTLPVECPANASIKAPVSRCQT
jgi:hypothetical protein